MNNMKISEATIKHLEDSLYTVTFGNISGKLISAQKDNIAAFVALGAAFAYNKNFKPKQMLRFNSIGMNGFFRGMCFQLKKYGDDETKKLVEYAESRFKPKGKFRDGMYGVVTQFSIGVTFYRDNFMNESLEQWTYYYQDGKGKQYVADILIGA